MIQKLFTGLVFVAASHLAGAQCNTPFSLGNDTLINCNSNFVIQAPAGMSSYAWNTGATESSITVNQAGTYFCYGTQQLANIVVNGDFSQGNTGFNSSYVPGTGGTYGLLSNEGQYALVSSPIQAHTQFANCYDHTVGTAAGNMMVINGAATANVNIWSQTVTVTPNTNYQFSVWGMSAVASNPGQLKFSINGSQLGNVFTLPSTTCLWQQFYVTCNSGASTSAVIAITNQNTNPSGNDFAIDDIAFVPVCTYYDEIVVTLPPNPVITASDNVTICAGESTDLTASSTFPGLTYAWTPGPVTGSTVSVSPAASTIYSVTGVGSNGCVSNAESVTVTVRPNPVMTIASDIANDTICPGSTAQLTASSNIVNTTYDWSPTTGQSNVLAVSPATTTTYTVTGTTPFGCTGTETYTLNVLPEIIVDITGNPTICDGGMTKLYANSNVSGTEFAWAPVSSIDDSITVIAANEGWYYLVGSYNGCISNTDSILVTASANPSIIVPDDFIVCPGETVTATVGSDLPGSTFTWMPGNLTGETNTLSSDGSTTYYVYATNNGCQSPVDSFMVNMSAACFLEVPNVFTPNGDNSNDVFKLINFSGIKTLECVIFNRWGNVVRTFDKPDFSWDGKDKSGNEATEGTYFYQIKAVTSANESLENTGFVQLVKQ